MSRLLTKLSVIARVEVVVIQTAEVQLVIVLLTCCLLLALRSLECPSVGNVECTALSIKMACQIKCTPTFKNAS